MSPLVKAEVAMKLGVFLGAGDDRASLSKSCSFIGVESVKTGGEISGRAWEYL